MVDNVTARGAIVWSVDRAGVASGGGTGQTTSGSFCSFHRITSADGRAQANRPSDVEGQIEGGVVQRIGWALNEEYIYDQKGRLDNGGFLDYRCPVASDLPMIEPILVQVPNPTHPYGVKGVGEVNICPP